MLFIEVCKIICDNYLIIIIYKLNDWKLEESGEDENDTLKIKVYCVIMATR